MKVAVEFRIWEYGFLNFLEQSMRRERTEAFS
jgi:hypothetical protein